MIEVYVDPANATDGPSPSRRPKGSWPVPAFSLSWLDCKMQPVQIGIAFSTDQAIEYAGRMRSGDLILCVDVPRCTYVLTADAAVEFFKGGGS
jgi:hypothetical protein